MHAISQLRQEHRAVIVAVNILAAMAEKAATAGHLELGDAENLLEILKVFVDQCHHGKEEKLLFPALEEVGIGRQGGPIGVMLSEHRFGRETIAALEAALRACRAGDLTAVRRFATHGLVYRELLERHIDKEDGVLFVLAERHLTRQALDDLATGFEEIEEREIGPGRHDHFHRILEQLAGRYGVAIVPEASKTTSPSPCCHCG